MQGEMAGDCECGLLVRLPVPAVVAVVGAGESPPKGRVENERDTLNAVVLGVEAVDESALDAVVEAEVEELPSL